jgi:hypothetical protein
MVHTVLWQIVLIYNMVLAVQIALVLCTIALVLWNKMEDLGYMGWGHSWSICGGNSISLRHILLQVYPAVVKNPEVTLLIVSGYG